MNTPVMLTFRKVRKCKQCSEVVQNCRLNCPYRRQDTYEQELLIRSLFVENLLYLELFKS